MTIHAPLSIDPRALWRDLEARFAADPALSRIALPPEADARALRCAAWIDGELSVARAGFYQSAGLWMSHAPALRMETGLVEGPEGRDHPLRPPKPTGLVYERHDPEADTTVSFRAVEIGRDLDMFHRWQNDPRVAFFWEENKPKEALCAFLEDRQADPHTFPVIGQFDGEDAGYFEIYWAREDRLGAHYDSAPYDRGWHGLIGERAHLGRRKTAAWLRGLTHYLFLDCPMTEDVVGEPRVDNAKLLRYADALAYEKVKEFDFPHKRSAFMRCRRELFFSKVRL